MQKDIPWDKIKKDYVTKDITTKELATKYCISKSSVEKKCCYDKWKEDKSKYYNTNAKKIIRKTSEKLHERVSEKIAKGLGKELNAAEKITDLIHTILDDPEQFRRHLISEYSIENGNSTVEKVFNKFDVRALQSLASTLAQVEGTKRKITGIMTTLEKERLQIDKERLAMDKEKAGKGETDNNIVIQLSPGLKELSE